MGRLTREDNAYANKTYVYEYITNGNIASKKTYAYTTGTLGTVQTTETRAYGNSNWLDQLTNINGTAITYDGMGNPLNWHNASAFTWEGRKLKSLTKTDGTVISYAYDENGIRTGKTAGSENVSYVLDGTKIVREIRSAYTLTFLYDDSGVLIGFNYNNGTTSADYYYGIDNWGNINYIYDSTGAVVVTYKYDAWGNAISTTGTLAGTIGAINPYRYKSYYYDAETGLYYLQSRYYDAQVQRFVSADEIEFLGASVGVYAFNLYSYCENDPINFKDSTGNGILGALILKGALYALATAVSQAVVVVAVAVVVVAVVAVATVAIYNSAKKASTKDRTLADVNVKQQSGKHYQLAYITKSGGLCRLGKKMDFVEALTALGVTGATNSISKRYEYDTGRSSYAQRKLEHMGSGNWGIYADTQSAAKALAVVFGWNNKPEVHSSGMYGHYHDSTHTFHIWYGGQLNY